MSCGVGCKRGSDLALLWLWRRLAATAPIQLLAWEPPYAVGAALEKAKRPKNKNKTKQKRRLSGEFKIYNNEKQNHNKALLITCV